MLCCLFSLCFQTLFKDVSHYVNILDSFRYSVDAGNAAVPLEILNELQRRYVTLQVRRPHIENMSCYFILTNDLSFSCSLAGIQVTAKCQRIKLEYQESRHTALNLLQCIGAKVQTWKAPYTSRGAILALLKGWHVSLSFGGLRIKKSKPTYFCFSNTCMSKTSCFPPGIGGASRCAGNSDGCPPRPERQSEGLHQHRSCR